LVDAHLEKGKYPNIYDSTVGLIFFGTPFRGTATLTIAKIVELAEQEFGKQVLEKALKSSEEDDEALTGLVDGYLRTTIGGIKPIVACFWERKQTNVAKIVNRELCVQSNDNNFFDSHRKPTRRCGLMRNQARST
jgi:hypothetical protein